MKTFLVLLIPLVLLMTNCTKNIDDKSGSNVEIGQANISGKFADETAQKLIEKYGDEHKFRIKRGVEQVAKLWREEDGSKEDFEKFCMENFIADDMELDLAFNKVSKNWESLSGHMNKMTLDLNETLHLDKGEIRPIDLKFGAYNPASHLTEDMFKNKIGFIVALNFPFYSLDEKIELGENWTRKDWAYARMGDMFVSRVPASLLQEVNTAQTYADAYISEYNIYMHNLVNDKGEKLFPEGLKLITHWGLRDELKSQYAAPDGLPRQEMIYQVMKRIVDQSIPEQVINSDKYVWNPYSNKLKKDGEEVKATPEPNERYQHILNSYRALREVDKFNPHYPTYIKAKFEGEMEIPQEKVEKMFVDFVSSPAIRKIGKLIETRLGRELQPFDIWYDGFKARSGADESQLDAKTKAKYPTTQAFAADIPNILTKLGFSHSKASDISSKITVDASRGAGHAWGADMKSEKAHLRTRVGKDGMDYKGYNIATHELGHNVEQTITLQDVDYYMLRGVPNTAFTEAWAFVFQKRDLDLLGEGSEDPTAEHLFALDAAWSTYEIMGVSLVDMRVWKWLYKNPDADAAELKNAVINIAKEVWNEYFADVFGVKDQPILAIYSHMIDYPLYLSAYPIGHLIEFQMEDYMKGKNLGEEMRRILVQGSVTPQFWMKGAVGEDISIEPMLSAAEKAVEAIKQ